MEDYDVENLVFWAMNQMRRAARLIDLLIAVGDLGDRSQFYADGLDECADECEKYLKKEQYGGWNGRIE